jgi:hypothetical protein
MLLSLTISLQETHLATRKRVQLDILLIVLITSSIAASAVPPCLIATIEVFSKLRALKYHEII